MMPFISSEWLKMTKRWMPRVILLMLMGLTVLAFWGQSTRDFARPNLFLPRGWLVVLTYCSFFAPFFWPVLGGSWAGGEYGWGTIRTILTRRPSRIQHVLAALIVLLIALAVALICLLVVGTVAAIAVSLATGNAVFVSGVWNADFLATMVKGFAAAWYVSGFFLVLAYTAGIVFRSSAVGIAIGIGSNLAELVLTRIFIDLGGIWNDIAQHFPFRYAQFMITQVVHSGMKAGTNLATVDPGTPSAGESLMALSIYGVVFLAVTLIAVQTRDVTA